MKILSVIGARPQFIKAAPLSQALRKGHTEVLVHTGQHFDHNMSQVFFDELEIPAPDYNLEVSGGQHGEQTGRMMVELEKVVLKEKPDVVLVYGDTNSTLAGSLVASKLQIPIAHVEAGLRSFNQKMPEEINRLLTDHISRWLFTTSSVGVENLRKEGITDNVFDVGDIMYDSVKIYSEKAKSNSKVLEKLELTSGEYFFSTIHRAENTDDKNRLSSILAALSESTKPIVIPLHPRTKKRMAEHGIEAPSSLRVIEPTGYLDTLQLIQNSAGTLTDSGGLQKESYYLQKPCVTLRDETEWIETLEGDWNQIVGADKAKIVKAMSGLGSTKLGTWKAHYGDGNAAEKIVRELDQA